MFQGNRKEENARCLQVWWSKCSSVPELQEERDCPLGFALVVFQCSKVIGEKRIHYVNGNGGPSVPVFQSYMRKRLAIAVCIGGPSVPVFQS